MYIPTRYTSGSSLSLPTPTHLLPLSPLPVVAATLALLPLSCSSHSRVATPVVWMKCFSIVAPFGVRRRACSVVSLVIPACCLPSWYSLQPRSRCLTLWNLSEHWNCVESYDGRRIRKDLKYPCSGCSWWIVEAVVWSVLVMSFVGSQLGL